MPESGGGFEQSYNAQAIVDNESMLVLLAHVTQAPNDKQQLQPMLEKLQALPAGLNSPRLLGGRYRLLQREECLPLAKTPRSSR